jgi:hypothetical protein
MDRPSSGFAYGLAGLVPIAVAGALVGVRGEIDSANLALVLVLVVVVTAVLAGRGPAALAAVSAALSFDFFFTQPYYSLRITEKGDIETALILLTIGLLVGQITVVARRSRAEAVLGRDELGLLRGFAARAAGGASTGELTRLATDDITALLHLHGCRFEPEPTGPPRPVLERSGRVESPVRVLVEGEFALPAVGVRLPVIGGGTEVGSILMDPDPTVGVSKEQRLVAVALADQLGAALAGVAPRR